MTTPTLAAAGPARLLDLVRHRSGPQGEAPAARPRYVFLDAVQYLPGWRGVLADLVRAHPRTRFVAVASALGPDAAGGGEPAPPTFFLPPLTFLEFLRFRGQEGTLFRAADGGAGLVFHERHLETLNREFGYYVNYGGFPEGVLKPGVGAPPPTFVRDGLLERVLHRDLAATQGIADPRELNRLFAVLAFGTGRETGIEQLYQTTGIAKNTVRKYLDYLEGAGLIRRVPRLDRSARPFRRAVTFKVHLTAPCLHAALFGPVGPDDPAFPRLVETAVAAQWLGSKVSGDLAYASWRGGRVDLLAHDPQSGTHEPGRPDLLYEFDWADRYGQGPKRPRTTVRFARRNCPRADVLVLTRRAVGSGILAGRAVRLVPAAVYCYVLRRDGLTWRIRAAER